MSATLGFREVTLACGCTWAVEQLGEDCRGRDSAICPNHWPDLPNAWQVVRRA